MLGPVHLSSNQYDIIIQADPCGAWSAGSSDDEREHLIEDDTRSIQLLLPYLGPEAVCPVALTFLDLRTAALPPM